MKDKQMSGKNIVSSMIWRFAERTGAQGVQLIVSIVLARLLLPSDYGTLALLTVFISIANVFVDSGFGSALIQKKDADEDDFSTVLIFNIFSGLVIYAIVFFLAPYIANFYNNPQLTSVLRVMALSLIIGSVKGVQQARISKTMQFRLFFFSTMIGTVISAVVGIIMAIRGAGVWALVAQNLTNSVIDMMVLWITSDWKPRFVFKVQRMKALFSFGGKMLVSGLLDTVYNNIYSLIIGKFYSAEELGLYNKGKSFPMLFVENINSTIQSVLFPAMAYSQDNIDTVKNMTRISIRTSTFFIFPMMVGLAAVANSFIVVLLTETWIESVFYLRACCFIYAFWPIHTANLAAIRALGRSDIFLRLEVIKKVIGITMLVVTIPLGVKAMVLGSCGTTIISGALNAYPNRTLLNYGYREQIRDLMPAMFLSLVMGACVYVVGFLHAQMLLVLCIQVVVGIIVYFGLAKLFRFEQLNRMQHIVKQLVTRK